MTKGFIMSKEYTTTTEMFFQLPVYNGKEYTLSCKKGRKLLARLSPDGKLFISTGYNWNTGLLLHDIEVHGYSEMYMASLVLDVLRQLYRVNHGYFAYNKSTIHQVYNYNMKQSKVAESKRWCYYVICKLRGYWKSSMAKWRV
tara:strand:+ start:994 stop:1422 length:429 start_codon:yes stop_codon:yes gene_type:complete